MSTSTLSAHSPKFASKLVTKAALDALPEPVALGTRHKPIPHGVLVGEILEEVERRDYLAVREQYALAADNQALFGVLDLKPKNAMVSSDRGVSFGFRTSTNSTLSLQGVAGTRVFVCDNLALSGSMITFKNKSTTRLDLGAVLASGFDKFMQHEAILEVQIARLTETSISDGEAKQRIFDVFNAKVVPVRLFDDVSRFYFHPGDDMTDVQPRSLWGLHNAFTRAMRDLTPVRLFNASAALGKAFELGGVVEAESVSVVVPESITLDEAAD